MAATRSHPTSMPSVAHASLFLLFFYTRAQSPASVFPIVDLSALSSATDTGSIRSISELVDGAFNRSGFVIITGHGITAGVAQSMMSHADKFFSSPLTSKLEIRAQQLPGEPGYHPPGVESTARLL